MSAHEDSPILVTGPECSGARWVQRFLSQHPRIHIHGRPPEIAWETFWGWYETLQERGDTVDRINQRVPSHVPYSAGSDPMRTREVFRQMLRDWLSGFGPEKPRWGVTWPGLCSDPTTVKQVETLWPEARWVVCLCNPLSTIELAKSTLWPEMDIRAAAQGWVETCQFLQAHGRKRVALFQPDRLTSFAKRRAAIDGILICTGEEPSHGTEECLRRWPEQNGAQKTFVLSDEAKEMLAEAVPGLERWMRRLGYCVPQRIV